MEKSAVQVSLPESNAFCTPRLVAGTDKPVLGFNAATVRAVVVIMVHVPVCRGVFLRTRVIRGDLGHCNQLPRFRKFRGYQRAFCGASYVGKMRHEDAGR